MKKKTFRSVSNNNIPEVAINDKKMARIVLNFVNGLDERVNALNKSFKDKDWENLRFYSHKLAGAKMFGFNELGEAALAIENLADKCSFDKINTLLKEVNSLCETANASKEGLAKLLKEE